MGEEESWSSTEPQHKKEVTPGNTSKIGRVPEDEIRGTKARKKTIGREVRRLASVADSGRYTLAEPEGSCWGPAHGAEVERWRCTMAVTDD